jgi:multiple sugar transport system ATP-binding protein
VASLEIRGLRKMFGAYEALRGIDLDIADRSFVVFVGPSGCGKSTLLRLIAGLEEPSGGVIRIDGEDVTDLSPAERGLAMVFQSYALYPHMTVRDNMAFSLRLAGVAKAEQDRKVAEAAGILQLGALLERRPRELSGGQRQRVAIGRAIVRNPRAFLFDEPLSNLDAALRVQMRIEIARLHQELSGTMIYVTHDQVEAMTLADQIVVMDHGRIEQVGPPIDLYHRPANLFVAGFIGSPKMNFVSVAADAADASGVAVRLPGGGEIRVPARPGQPLEAGEPMTLGIRPEHFGEPGRPGPGLSGHVEVVERLGSTTLAHIRLADGLLATVQYAGDRALKPGETLNPMLDPAACHLFDRSGKALARMD